MGVLEAMAERSSRRRWSARTRASTRRGSEVEVVLKSADAALLAAAVAWIEPALERRAAAGPAAYPFRGSAVGNYRIAARSLDRGAPRRPAPMRMAAVAFGLRRYLIPLAIAGATVAGFVDRRPADGGGAVSAATSPDWLLLAAAFGVGAVVQPLRALAWRQTLGARRRLPRDLRRERRRLVPRHDSARPAGRGLEGRRPPRRRGRALARPSAGGRQPAGGPPDGGDRLLPRRRDSRASSSRSRTGRAGRWSARSASPPAGSSSPPRSTTRSGPRLPKWADGFLAAAAAPRARAPADARDPRRHLGRALDRRAADPERRRRPRRASAPRSST